MTLLMGDVQIYLSAPTLKRVGRKRRLMRGLKIEWARFHDDGTSYEPLGVIYDGFIPCDKDADPACYTMRGRVTGAF